MHWAGQEQRLLQECQEVWEVRVLSKLRCRMDIQESRVVGIAQDLCPRRRTEEPFVIFMREKLSRVSRLQKARVVGMRDEDSSLLAQ